MSELLAGALRCPHCGLRSPDEFRFAGDATIERPSRSASDAVWSAYLHVRDNPRGLAREYWVHSQGCGRWLIVARDTVTHAVHSVGEATP
jgi:sarcosine oxidase subunit delta